MDRYPLRYAQQTWLVTLHYSIYTLVGSGRHQKANEVKIFSRKHHQEDNIIERTSPEENPDRKTYFIYLLPRTSPTYGRTHVRLDGHKSTYRPSTDVLAGRFPPRRINHLPVPSAQLRTFAFSKISNYLRIERIIPLPSGCFLKTGDQCPITGLLY